MTEAPVRLPPALCVFLLSIHALAGQSTWHANECPHRIVLRCATVKEKVDAQPSTFFLGLRDIGRRLGGFVETRSMALVSAGDGRVIPFSLDYRYGDRHDLPPPNPRYSKPNGYWGRKFPASKEELRRLGFLSFRPVPDERRYLLYFAVSKDAKALRARPQPDIRPWWIEQCRDPTFAVNTKGRALPDYYAGWGRKGWRHVKQPSPEGEHCFEVALPKGGRLIGATDLFDFDRRIAGRRIVLYHLLYAEKGLSGRNIYLPLPSALRAPPRHALYYSFADIPPATWYALCVEGRVSNRFQKFTRRLYANYNGPCLLGAFHLQFPPDLDSSNVIGIGSDIAAPNDYIPLEWRSSPLPYYYSMLLPLQTRLSAGSTPANVAALRIEHWPDGFAIEAELTSEEPPRPWSSITAKAASGETWAGHLPVGNVRPGAYQVRLTVRNRDRSAIVAQLTRDLRVIKSPLTRVDGKR